MYLVTDRITKDNHLPAYEISNHSKIYKKCDHNLAYWRGGDWIGIGPGATSRFSHGKKRLQVDIRKDPTGWINDVKNKVIKALSKGYKQRVGLAQAIIHEPEVLILDEPTIGLDPIQIREVRDLIKSLAGNHTIVLSTHILPEVDMTCDEVVIIKKGKIIAQDTPKNLSKKMNKSSLEEIFIDLISESRLEKK